MDSQISREITGGLKSGLFKGQDGFFKSLFIHLLRNAIVKTNIFWVDGFSKILRNFQSGS
jgi:hypothetical protein